ncbi:RNA polymerase sigma factor [Membranihabitans maritimus]|uniref:RNA polymerase sigma factor n=1 Tax=Membranihabitans maritimus TaxID=2904244 RepID=UPI001F01DC11
MDNNGTDIHAIIDKYYPRVYAFALLHVISEHIAKDLTQDVFLQLVKKQKELKKIENLEAYIFTIARNRTYKYFKKINNNNTLKDEMIQSYCDEFVEVEEEIIAEDLEDKIKNVIDQLPVRQREVFLLSREQGLTYKEIAEELKISPHTVRNHLAQALKTLKLNYKLFGFDVLLLLYLSFNL